MYPFSELRKALYEFVKPVADRSTISAQFARQLLVVLKSRVPKLSKLGRVRAGCVAPKMPTLNRGWLTAPTFPM
jgi:hypothetical protein